MNFCYPVPQTDEEIGTSKYTFNSIPDCEFEEAEVLFSVVETVEPREMAAQMKISQNVFEPVLRAYQGVFDNNRDLSSILSEFYDTSVYSDDVIKLF